MGILNKNAILAVVDLPTELVAVPEWGGEVYVRGMNGIERDQFELSIMGSDKKQNLENIRARLVALTVVDEQGERLFTDDDVTALGRKSATALNRVVEVAQRLSAIRNDDVEQLTKN